MGSEMYEIQITINPDFTNRAMRIMQEHDFECMYTMTDRISGAMKSDRDIVKLYSVGIDLIDELKRNGLTPLRLKLSLVMKDEPIV